MTSRALVYRQIPEAEPIAGKDIVVETVTFDRDAAPPAGGLIVQLLYASYDPYLRNRMKAPETAQGFATFTPGVTIPNFNIVKVLKSDHPTFKAGDVLNGFGLIQEYFALSPDEIKGYKLLKNPYNLDQRFFLGPTGPSGLAAYSSLLEIGQPKAGETILITAASGAIGQIVGQIAKQRGLMVLGTVGSDEKLDLLINQLGFDGGINWKKGNLVENLKRIAPQGVDILYDSVSGPLFEAAIDVLKLKARVVACGYASQYNVPPEKQYGIRNMGTMIKKRVTWRGFDTDLTDFAGKYVDEHVEVVSKWIHDGSFKPLLDVTYGMENAAEGLAKLTRGSNVGKALLDVTYKA
ncbi:NADP-dependent leukotriene B4 12-hydroxydehydrogenase [Ilyonectria robusta]